MSIVGHNQLSNTLQISDLLRFVCDVFDFALLCRIGELMLVPESAQIVVSNQLVKSVSGDF